jgi:hypothetical protein
LLSYAKVLKYNPDFELTKERVAVLKKQLWGIKRK